MLNKSALDLIQPATQRSAIRISCQSGFVIVEFERDTGHLQMTRAEATQFVKALVERINELTLAQGTGKLIVPKGEMN